MVLAVVAGCAESDRRPGARVDAGTERDAASSDAARIDAAPADATRPTVDSAIVRLPDGGWSCGGEDIVLERLPAQLVFVVDRSSSTLEASVPPTPSDRGSCAETNTRPATGISYRTRWDDLGAAIVEVAEARDDRVSFGLTLFPGPGALDGAGDPVRLFCESRPPTGLVAPRPDAGPEIRAALTNPANAPVCSGGFTPTRRALEVAGTALVGEGAIVLATDGGPNCGSSRSACSGARCTAGAPFCDGTLGTFACLDDAATVEAIAALRARGVRTYVVGIPGTEAFGSTLDAMAEAGGTARAGETAYYRAEDAASLVAALGSISDREVSCRFSLASPPPDRTNVNVLLDGEPSPRSDADGWQLADDGTWIELRGPTCELHAGGGRRPRAVRLRLPSVDLTDAGTGASVDSDGPLGARRDAPDTLPPPYRRGTPPTHPLPS